MTCRNPSEKGEGLVRVGIILCTSCGTAINKIYAGNGRGQVQNDVVRQTVASYPQN